MEGINSLLNRKRKNRKAISKMKWQFKNETTTNLKEIPSILNQYFASVGGTLAHKLPTSNDPNQYLANKNKSSFFFDPLLAMKSNLKLLECHIMRQMDYIVLVPYT